MNKQCFRAYTRWGNGQNEGLLLAEDDSGIDIPVSPGLNYPASGSIPMAKEGFEKVSFWAWVLAEGGGAETLDYGTYRARWDSGFWSKLQDTGSLAYADYSGAGVLGFELPVSDCRDPAIKINLAKSGAGSTWSLFKLFVVRFRYEQAPLPFGS